MPPHAHAKLRRALIETCRAMNGLGLNQGTAGNASARVPEGLLITPSGLAYERMKPDDIVVIDAGGRAHGARPPSSEWRFHFDILRQRAEVGAVLHAHPPFCTALACLGRDIPAFHYMVAVAGGDSIRCAPYATFGTQALSDHALEALEGRLACLLANHGMICVAAGLDAALDLAVEVETLAQQYWRALQVGAPQLLSADEMRTVLRKFQSYGKR
ncbi:MAG: class II aldolase/adducin family protein [Rhodospirillales bacterium]|nr:MAG: class II aldolase/adducin family protein [Rhodospirillales bacterium]